jgi:hypothetical protein
MRLRCVAILLPIFSAFAGEVGDGRIDTQYYYRLTNSYLGEGYSLDTASAPNDPNVPVMAKSSNSAGQYWKFSVQGSCYKLSNVLLGPDRSLDNYPTGLHPPFMGPTGNFSGQCWHPAPAGGGYIRLTNDYSGDSHSLDTYSDRDHKPFMAESSTATGQFWKLTRLTRQ